MTTITFLICEDKDIISQLNSTHMLKDIHPWHFFVLNSSIKNNESFKMSKREIIRLRHYGQKITNNNYLIFGREFGYSLWDYHSSVTNIHSILRYLWFGAIID